MARLECGTQSCPGVQAASGDAQGWGGWHVSLAGPDGWAELARGACVHPLCAARLREAGNWAQAPTEPEAEPSQRPDFSFLEGSSHPGCLRRAGLEPTGVFEIAWTMDLFSITRGIHVHSSTFGKYRKTQVKNISHCLPFKITGARLVFGCFSIKMS